jgi:hypothetical protein
MKNSHCATMEHLKIGMACTLCKAIDTLYLQKAHRTTKEEVTSALC